MNGNISLQQIRSWLATHQRRLKVGDNLPFMTEIGRRGGIHRDTIYALLNGDNVSERTQYALTRLMREIEDETASNTKTRLMSISFNQGVPKLHIGLQAAPILCKRRGVGGLKVEG